MGITSGATNENDALTITATSSNPALIPNPSVTYASPDSASSLAFTPAANNFGTATITVTVNDGQAQNNSVTRTFAVSVGPVNQPPTLNPISNLTINENDGPQTVNLAGITAGPTNEVQVLSVTATSSNPALIPNPTVNYTSPNSTGTLTFSPAVNGFGTATITVTVNDGQSLNNTGRKRLPLPSITFNQSPTLNAINDLAVNENGGPQTVSLRVSEPARAMKRMPLQSPRPPAIPP